MSKEELFEDVKAALIKGGTSYAYGAGFSNVRDIKDPVAAHLKLVNIDGEYALVVPWCGKYYREAGWATRIPWTDYKSYMFANRSETRLKKDGEIDGVMRAIGHYFDDKYDNSELQKLVRQYLDEYKKSDCVQTS